jgi:hypothetical protein
MVTGIRSSAGSPITAADRPRAARAGPCVGSGVTSNAWGDCWTLILAAASRMLGRGRRVSAPAPRGFTQSPVHARDWRRSAGSTRAQATADLLHSGGRPLNFQHDVLLDCCDALHADPPRRAPRGRWPCTCRSTSPALQLAARQPQLPCYQGMRVARGRPGRRCHRGSAAAAAGPRPRGSGAPGQGGGRCQEGRRAASECCSRIRPARCGAVGGGCMRLRRRPPAVPAESRFGTCSASSVSSLLLRGGQGTDHRRRRGRPVWLPCCHPSCLRSPPLRRRSRCGWRVR